MSTRKTQWHFFIFLLLLSFACSEKPKIEGFNSEVWKKDKKGCSGKRAYLAEIILSKSQELRGLDDDEIAELLGKPEATDWESRERKIYFYYIQAGSQCDSSLILEGAKIAIEFDALGRVHLITERKF